MSQPPEKKRKVENAVSAALTRSLEIARAYAERAEEARIYVQNVEIKRDIWEKLEDLAARFDCSTFEALKYLDAKWVDQFTKVYTYYHQEDEEPDTP